MIAVMGSLLVLCLDVKGGEIEVIFPSMPKGDIVGNMEDGVIGIDVNI